MPMLERERDGGREIERERDRWLERGREAEGRRDRQNEIETSVETSIDRIHQRDRIQHREGETVRTK